MSPAMFRIPHSLALLRLFWVSLNTIRGEAAEGVSRPLAEPPPKHHRLAPAPVALPPPRPLGEEAAPPEVFVPPARITQDVLGEVRVAQNGRSLIRI